MTVNTITVEFSLGQRVLGAPTPLRLLARTDHVKLFSWPGHAAIIPADTNFKSHPQRDEEYLRCEIYLFQLDFGLITHDPYSA